MQLEKLCLPVFYLICCFLSLMAFLKLIRKTSGLYQGHLRFFCFILLPFQLPPPRSQIIYILFCEAVYCYFVPTVCCLNCYFIDLFRSYFSVLGARDVVLSFQIFISLDFLLLYSYWFVRYEHQMNNPIKPLTDPSCSVILEHFIFSQFFQ